jgi:hypothetical protein
MPITGTTFSAIGRRFARRIVIYELTSTRRAVMWTPQFHDFVDTRRQRAHHRCMPCNLLAPSSEARSRSTSPYSLVQRRPGGCRHDRHDLARLPARRQRADEVRRPTGQALHGRRRDVDAISADSLLRLALRRDCEYRTVDRAVSRRPDYRSQPGVQGRVEGASPMVPRTKH